MLNETDPKKTSTHKIISLPLDAEILERLNANRASNNPPISNKIQFIILIFTCKDSRLLVVYPPDYNLHLSDSNYRTVHFCRTSVFIPSLSPHKSMKGLWRENYECVVDFTWSTKTGLTDTASIDFPFPALRTTSESCLQVVDNLFVCCSQQQPKIFAFSSSLLLYLQTTITKQFRIRR